MDRCPKVGWQSKGRFQPIPPFFWDASRRATLHGTLTTAQKFIGENIFVNMMTDAVKVVKVMNWITESFIVLVKHYSKLASLPVMAGN